MRIEEIKAQTGILEVAAMYGCHPNTKGFCHCPFPGHSGDRTPSLKLYPEQGTFHCFGCGANGDIFDFVRKIEGCDFKTAFQKLGGEYKEMSDAARIFLYHKQKQREASERCEEAWKRKLRINSLLLGIYRKQLAETLPMSNEWADAAKRYEYQVYLAECLDDMDAARKEAKRHGNRRQRRYPQRRSI